MFADSGIARQRSSALEGAIGVDAAPPQQAWIPQMCRHPPGAKTKTLSTASDLLVHVVLQAMDGASQGAAALCACKAAFSLLFLPSLAASNSVVGFCCCCLLLFTDLIVAGEWQDVRGGRLVVVVVVVLPPQRQYFSLRVESCFLIHGQCAGTVPHCHKLPLLLLFEVL